MENPFDIFDAIFCINLKRRKDRWEQSLKEFEKLGIKDKVERFDAVELKDNVAGCANSHYMCVKEAKKRNLKNVLIFEDDITFVENSLETFKNSINHIPEDWDMLFLGANTHTPLKKINEYWYKLTNAYALHAYAYNSNIYDYFLNNYKLQENIKKHDDIIDVWVANNLQTKFNVYVIKPIIALQRLSYSDLSKTITNHNYIISRAKNNMK